MTLRSVVYAPQLLYQQRCLLRLAYLVPEALGYLLLKHPFEQHPPAVAPEAPPPSG